MGARNIPDRGEKRRSEHRETHRQRKHCGRFNRGRKGRKGEGEIKLKRDRYTPSARNQNEERTWLNILSSCKRKKGKYSIGKRRTTLLSQVVATYVSKKKKEKEDSRPEMVFSYWLCKEGTSVPLEKGEKEKKSKLSTKATLNPP